MKIEEGDVLMCTVDRIVGTVVFVRIDETGEEGSIVVSEIAPGRIRNLRDYVFPKKKIACKVLRKFSNGHIELSLRRVTQKEEKEVKELAKLEKNQTNILKSVLGEKAEKVIEEIKKTDNLYEFLQEAKENPSKLGKLVDKSSTEKILTILNSQKQKKATLKKEIHLSTTKPEGISLIKKILSSQKEVEITYISAGKYLIKAEDQDIKKADNKIRDALKSIEEQAEKQKMKFSVIEK